jgi:hypothetical protein
MTLTYSPRNRGRTSPARAAVLAVALVALGAGAARAISDVPGSSDHPLFKRMPFAYIVDYAQHDPGEYHLVTGPLPADDAALPDAEGAKSLAGTVTRIHYSIAAMTTAADVFYMYDYLVKSSRFETLVETKGAATRAPGGSVWLAKVFASLDEDARKGLVESVAPSQRRFYAGRLDRPEGALYVVFVINQHTDREVRMQLDVIETK